MRVFYLNQKILKHYNKQEYVYKDCAIKMSINKMSDLMYAIIMTQAALINSYGIGIYNYNRKQNTYNQVDIKINIHPDCIEQFEQLSNVKLKEPIKILIN